MDNDLQNKLLANPEMIEQVLNPGRYLHTIRPEELPIQVMPSGFPSLDESLFLKRGEGEIVIIAARPSVGKSAFAFQIANFVSQTEEVHVFSLEMSFSSIGRRMLSPIMGCPIQDLLHDRVPDEVAPGITRLSRKYFLDDEAGLNIDEICDRASNHARKSKTALIVIDYIQIIGIEKGHSRALEIGEAMAKLKRLGKELRCPILVLAQLNRESEKRGANGGKYTPLLSDLKESGSLEEAADVVLGLHRESRYTNTRHGEADIFVLKNRNGPLNEYIFKYNAATCTFEDPQNEEI